MAIDVTKILQEALVELQVERGWRKYNGTIPSREASMRMYEL